MKYFVAKLRWVEAINCLFVPKEGRRMDKIKADQRLALLAWTPMVLSALILRLEPWYLGTVRWALKRGEMGRLGLDGTSYDLRKGHLEGVLGVLM